MAKLYLILLLAVVLTHATARNIPNDHQTTNPNPNALAPAQTTENLSTGAGAPPATNAAAGDQKNFISYGGGIGGWGGIGYVGVLPVIGGVGGTGGLGGLGGGIGKAGGIGIGGGIGKVGGIGVGGGLGKVGGIGVGGVGGVGGIAP